MFRTAFPDLRAEIEDIFGVGDRVAVRLTFRGTHHGAFFGMPATGREVMFSSVEIYRVAGDQLAEEWVSPDVTSLMGQLGAWGG
jgi:predicted ester cyclase